MLSFQLFVNTPHFWAPCDASHSRGGRLWGPAIVGSHVFSFEDKKSIDPLQQSGGKTGGGQRKMMTERTLEINRLTLSASSPVDMLEGLVVTWL